MGLENFQIAELSTKEELERAFPVLKELRQELIFEDYLRLLREAQANSGYQLWAALRGQEILGLMGVRVLTDFVHARHLYIDDLVVTDKFRSQGLGAKLLEFAEDLARTNSCRGLRLCTGVSNQEAVRFYERLGWQARAYSFKKKL